MSFVGSKGRSNDSSTVDIFVTELNLLPNAGCPAFGAQEETDQQFLSKEWVSGCGFVKGKKRQRLGISCPLRRRLPPAATTSLSTVERVSRNDWAKKPTK